MRQLLQKSSVDAHILPCVFPQLQISHMLNLQQQYKSTEWTGLLYWLCCRYKVDHLWVFPAPCCLAEGFSPCSQRETFWILSIWMPSQQISHTELHCAEAELPSTDSFRPHSDSPLTDKIAEYWVPTGHQHRGYRWKNTGTFSCSHA